MEKRYASAEKERKHNAEEARRRDREREEYEETVSSQENSSKYYKIRGRGEELDAELDELLKEIDSALESEKLYIQELGRSVITALPPAPEKHAA